MKGINLLARAVAIGRRLFLRRKKIVPEGMFMVVGSVFYRGGETYIMDPSLQDEVQFIKEHCRFDDIEAVLHCSNGTSFRVTASAQCYIHCRLNVNVMGAFSYAEFLTCVREWISSTLSKMSEQRTTPEDVLAGIREPAILRGYHGLEFVREKVEFIQIEPLYV